MSVALREALAAGHVTRVIENPDEMDAFGREFASLVRAGDLIVLTGPLGAGKTTFTRGLGEALGVRGPVTSPTFVLARTHPSLDGGPALVHVDAYRLGSALELDDLDIDFAHSVVVVEWGAGLLDGVAESWLELVIDRPTAGDSAVAGSASDGDLEAPEPRTITITAHGPRWSAGA